MPDNELSNALTIDLEDWYQGLTSTSRKYEQWSEFEDRVVESCDRILEIISHANVKATFFVLGYVADQFPDLIKRVADAGHEIALHSYRHRQVSQLTPEEFRADVVRGLEAVQEASGREVLGYRAPMFSINSSSLWALEELRDLGFRYDSSIFPMRNFYYGIHDAPRSPFRPFDGNPFVEFPVATVRLLGMNWPVAGGFYLRLFPYALIKRGIERINREGKPAIIYLHPWDLDPDQPYPNPTLRERFTHYYNLSTTEEKLRRLLSDFRFGPLCKLLDNPELMEKM